ncbi:hypothetical protein HT031_000384 [Scenedesmus sp. PABB004]|nr:hypothetical protein HT031_000384 [Scenedesmus sp. PABB004]
MQIQRAIWGAPAATAAAAAPRCVRARRCPGAEAAADRQQHRQQQTQTQQHMQTQQQTQHRQQHRQTQTQHRPLGRRGTLAAAAAAGLLLAAPQRAARAAAARPPAVDPALAVAFQEALAARSFADADAAWGRAIALAPENAAARSNRGTVRLQAGEWAAAYDDLAAAAALEAEQRGAASGVLLNNLGNAEGALGRWPDALRHYRAAGGDAEVGAIALANYALAAWETGDAGAAVATARQLLRRDPEFLDARAALTAFLWGSGQRSAAEGEWEALQQASDGLGAALYSATGAVERVRHRWPPRATAALVAFLNVADEGEAEGYDLVVRRYTFGAA